MKHLLLLVVLCASSLTAIAQESCTEKRNDATWQSTTLMDLTYECIPRGWASFFNDPAIKTEVKKISDKLKNEVDAGNDVNPAIGDVFRAMYEVSGNGVKAIIVGQDPAPTKGEATGLAFSLKPGTPSEKVASVQRVMLEAANEGFKMDLTDGNLSSWADHGALMLNTALTIPCKKNASSCTIAGHLSLWKSFSKQLIAYIDSRDSAMVFILWGSKAGALASKIKNPLHYVIKGGHPSPLSNPKNFYCKSYFSCSNKWLDDHDISAVDWNVPNGFSNPQACIWQHGKTPKCKSTCSLVACQ